MPRNLDTRIAEILKNYGEDPYDTKNVVWDCHGTWVIYHRALERVAAKAGIKFESPEILRCEKDEAVILVHGTLGDRNDWEIGECLLGVNYRVSPKQAAYVWAMASKRARDRLILKLIGLHGLIYSEEEADDFKQRASHNDDAPRETEAQAYVRLVRAALRDFQGAPEILHSWWLEEAPHREQHGITKGTPEFDELVRMFAHKKDQLLTMKEAAE